MDIFEYMEMDYINFKKDLLIEELELDLLFEELDYDIYLEDENNNEEKNNGEKNTKEQKKGVVSSIVSAVGNMIKKFFEWVRNTWNAIVERFKNFHPIKRANAFIQRVFNRLRGKKNISPEEANEIKKDIEDCRDEANKAVQEVKKRRAGGAPNGASFGNNNTPNENENEKPVKADAESQKSQLSAKEKYKQQQHDKRKADYDKNLDLRKDMASNWGNRTLSKEQETEVENKYRSQRKKDQEYEKMKSEGGHIDMSSVDIGLDSDDNYVEFEVSADFISSDGRRITFYIKNSRGTNLVLVEGKPEKNLRNISSLEVPTSVRGIKLNPNEVKRLQVQVTNKVKNKAKYLKLI